MGGVTRRPFCMESWNPGSLHKHTFDGAPTLFERSREPVAEEPMISGSKFDEGFMVDRTN